MFISLERSRIKIIQFEKVNKKGCFKVGNSV